MSPVFGETRAGHPLSERPEFGPYVFLKWLVYGRLEAQASHGTNGSARRRGPPTPDQETLLLGPTWVAQQAARVHLRAGWTMPATDLVATARTARHTLDRLDNGVILHRSPNHPMESPKFRWIEPVTRGTWASYRNLTRLAKGRIEVAMAVHHVVERFGLAKVELAALRASYGRRLPGRGVARWFRRRRPEAPPGWERHVVAALTAAGALVGRVPTEHGLRIGHWYELFAYSVDYVPEPAAHVDDAAVETKEPTS